MDIVLSEANGRRGAPKGLERTDPVYLCHEVQLKPVAITRHAVPLRCRIARTKHDGAQIVRNPLEFVEICRRLSKHEVEIHRRDRRSLNRGGSIADEHDIHTMPREQARDEDEHGLRVHAEIISFASRERRADPEIEHHSKNRPDGMELTRQSSRRTLLSMPIRSISSPSPPPYCATI